MPWFNIKAAYIPHNKVIKQNNFFRWLKERFTFGTTNT